MSGQLEIHVLGELRVLRDGVALTLPPSRKTRALLAYLAVVDRPQRRERLCEMFWDIPDDPRGSLRWSLSKLRRIVDDDGRVRLDAQRDTVILDVSDVAMDLRAVAGLDAAGGLEAAAVETLEQAAAAFRGTFLEDLSLANCPDFEAWRTAHANAFEILRLRVLRTLVARLRDDPVRALPHAHALRALDPEDESLAREVESLAAAARAGAVSAPVPQARDCEPAPAPDPAPAPRSAPAPPPQEIRYCTAPDGVRIAYSIEGSGPPLVRAAHWLSHLQYDRESPVWRNWIEGLTAHNTLIRYDERCCGLSDWQGDLSFEAMVADLETVVDAAGLSRFALLGVSQSCAVAVAYAVRHPERVSHLVLYGGYVKGWRKRGDPREIASREALAVLMREGWGQNHPVFRQLFTTLFIPDATREQMTWLNDLQLNTVSPANAWRLQNCFGDVDVSDLLPQVTVPTMVMHAGREAVAPLAQGRAFAEGIPGARWIELDSANHILLRDEPAFTRFLEELRAFVASEPRPATPPSPPDEPARKQATAMSLEIVSPLAAFEDDDPEAAFAAMDPLLAAAREAVEGAGGILLAGEPTGFTAVFGAPVATEDHAARACRAALAARDAVERLADGAARVRAGIDTGELLVRRRAHPIVGGLEAAGAPLRHARQLAQALRRSCIAATARTQAAATGYFRMERLGHRDCPGLGRDRRVFEVVAENRALSRWSLRGDQRLTPLIGRETEMQMLIRALYRARAGHGQVVGVVADPGLGKSRLTHEFLASEEVAGCTILEIGALEYDAAVSHGMVRKAVRALCGIGGGDGAATARAKVLKRLAAFGADERLLPPLLFALDLSVDDPAWQGLDGATRGEHVADALRAVLALEARKAPVVLLVEDLHWMDPGSEAVLTRIVEGIEGQRLLLLLTYRPEYKPPFAGHGTFQPLRLDPLDLHEMQRLVRELVGCHPSVLALLPLLVERAEGVPLFAEESVRALVQDGRLAGRPRDYHALTAVSEVQVPPTVQSVIAARIDRLPDDDRRLLQVAAVIGRDVPHAVLEAVAGLPADRLAAGLTHLKGTEFLFETQCYPEREYTFKHAITHDVTYASLLRDRRRGLHASVLAVLERRLGTPVEQLAAHALEAEEWEKAAGYLLEASDRAIDRSAYGAAAEALEQAARALTALPETPERLRRAVDVRTRMRPALDGIGAFHRAKERLAEARALAGRLGDPERLAQVLLHQSYIDSTHGDLDDAVAHADELKALALDHGFERYAREADLAAAQALLLRSDAETAQARLAPHYQPFVTQWRGERFGQFGTRSLWYLGHCAVAAAYLGDRPRAETLAAQAQGIAEETRRPFDLFFALYFRTRAQLLTEVEAVDLAAVEAQALSCRTHPTLTFQCWLLATLGHAQLRRGAVEAARATLALAVQAAERVHMRQFRDYARVVTALLPGSGESCLNQALLTAAALGDQWLKREVLREMAGRGLVAAEVRA